MAEGTLIEWARHPATGLGATWNIVTGCSVVSPGCTNCYAMKLAGTRLRNHPTRKGLTRPSRSGPVWTGEVRFNEEWLTLPLAWKKPHGIFVAAHGDLFAEGVTDDQLDRIFAVMALTPQHVYYVLTKRPERMREYTGRVFAEADWERARRLGYAIADAKIPYGASDVVKAPVAWPLPNVWLGVSVEDQPRANERIPILLDTPAAIRFISAEPLIGPIDLTEIRFRDGDVDIVYNVLTGEIWAENSESASAYDAGLPRLDWIIAGGESGPRPMHPDWAISLRDQCADADTAFFFKQWGSWLPVTHDDGQISYGQHLRHEFPDGLHTYKVGKGEAGRELLGRTHDEYPEIRT